MILPKQIDINKAKAQERKAQIDEGLVLAKRVDELRQMRLDMEKNFEVWRQGISKSTQRELDTLTEERDDMAKQVIEARNTRNELLKPLDDEWKVIEKEKYILSEAKNELFLDKERLNIELNKLESDKKKLLLRSKKVSEVEKEIEAIKEEVIHLRDSAKNGHSEMLISRENQDKANEKRVEDISRLQKEYEVGISLIEVREKQVIEKEDELIIRENDLTRRIKNLQRVEEN